MVPDRTAPRRVVGQDLSGLRTHQILSDLLGARFGSEMSCFLECNRASRQPPTDHVIR